MKFIGIPYQRVDASSKVKGEALFPGDFNIANQVYMKVLFSNRPHAIVNNINIDKAMAINGVITILTAKDVPVNAYGLIMQDQPVLCGPGHSSPNSDRVRFIGDQIAVVIAEDEKIAATARDAIEVTYSDLPVIDNVWEAMKSDSYLLHPELSSNIFCNYQIRKGNTEEGFRQSDVIVESEYHTPAQEHAYLQPEAGLSFIDEQGRVTVVVAGQWTHEDQKEIAHALALPLDRVRVIYPAIGGAFGGREDMSIQIILALAAMRLQEKGIDRPVKIVWNREESIIGHHKRHPYHFRARWGARKDGSLLAADVRVIADGGAYAYTSTKVLGNATLMCTGPYEIPNVAVDAYAVYTNAVPSGAFRGFGGPQGAFAAESQINKLAEALGIDPVELRLKNILREGSLLSVGTPLPRGVNLDKVISNCAEAADWKSKFSSINLNLLDKDKTAQKLNGVGFSCAYKNVGFSFGAPEQCQAKIELRGQSSIEKAILYHAGAEVGQGVHTILAQMTAEALDIPIEKIELVLSDTATSGDAGSVSASRMTFMAGNAIRGAAEIALNKWKSEERPAVGHFQYRPPKTSPYETGTGKSEPNFAYGYVAEIVEVEVDPETGHIEITNVVCGDDVGKAINPQLVEGQIEGAIVQAYGYGVLENFIQKSGAVETRNFSTYLIPSVLDIPRSIQSVIAEYPDPIGPWGARGMGEMPFLPFVPALTAAIHSATGVWFDEFPLTPERILKGLGKL